MRFGISSRMRVELLRSKSSVLIVIVGILITIASAIAIVGHENVHLPWQGKYTVHVEVDDATGVVAGLDEARWGGIVVGRVTKLSLNGGHPVLTVEMNPADLHGARLYKNATVQVRPQTPLSDEYLDVVSRGTPSAGLLRSSDVLTAEHSQTPVNIADVLDTFSEPVRDRLQELLSELATGLSHAGGQQLRDAFGEIVPLLQAQKTLSDTLSQRRMIVSGLVHDTKLLFDELSARNADLSRLVDNGAGTFRALGTQSPQLANLIGELPTTLTQMKSSFGQLQTTLADVRPALSALLPTARALPTGLNALKRFSTPAAPALRSLEPSLTALQPLAKNLVPTSRALRAAFTKLAPQAGQLNSITTKLVPCELPVDKFFALTLSTFKYGNTSNLSDSPRGILAVPLSAVNTKDKDPTVSPVIGCADGLPAPTSTLH